MARHTPVKKNFRLFVIAARRRIRLIYQVLRKKEALCEVRGSKFDRLREGLRDLDRLGARFRPPNGTRPPHLRRGSVASGCDSQHPSFRRISARSRSATTHAATDGRARPCIAPSTARSGSEGVSRRLRGRGPGRVHGRGEEAHRRAEPG
jgi:hypothetical protein